MSSSQRDNFLLYLALNASPTRFFPFPEYFKTEQALVDEKIDSSTTDTTTTDTTTTDTPASTAIIKKRSKLNKANRIAKTSQTSQTSQTAKTSQLPDEFMSYSDEDYKRVKQTLIKIREKINIETFPGNLDTDEMILYQYLIYIPIELYCLGSTFNKHILEYEFRYERYKERLLDIKYPKRWYLFHGSPLINWHSILRNGIKSMSGTKFMTSGQVCGPGVYMSNVLSIASGYGGSAHIDSNFKDPGHFRTCVAIVELYEDPTQYEKAKGIFVIPQDKKITPRHLLEIQCSVYEDCKSILEYHTKLSQRAKMQNDKSIACIKKQIERINVRDDMKLTEKNEEYTLLTLLISNITDTSTTLNGILIECYTVNYPFDAPVIKLAYKPTVPSDKFDSYGIYLYKYDDWSPSKKIIDLLIELKRDLYGMQMSDEYLEM